MADKDNCSSEDEDIKSSQPLIAARNHSESGSPGLRDSASTWEPNSQTTSTPSSFGASRSQSQDVMEPLRLEEEEETQNPNAFSQMETQKLLNTQEDEIFESSCPNEDPDDFCLPGIGSTPNTRVNQSGTKRPCGESDVDEHINKKSKGSTENEDETVVKKDQSSRDVFDVEDDSFESAKGADASVIILDPSPSAMRSTSKLQMPPIELSGGEDSPAAKTRAVEKTEEELEKVEKDFKSAASSFAGSTEDLFHHAVKVNLPLDHSASPIVHEQQSETPFQNLRRACSTPLVPSAASEGSKTDAIGYTVLKSASQPLITQKNAELEKELVDGDERYFLILGSKEGLSQSDVDRLKLRGLSFTKVSVPEKQSEEMFLKLTHASDGFPVSHFESEPFLKPSRFSDVSTSTATSGGYRADGSSGISSSSSTVVRDRLSIMPEASIPKSKVIAPLPKKKCFKKKSELRRATENRDLQEVDENEPPWENDIPIPPSEEKDDCRKIRMGTLVFAKYVERTQHRYWAAEVNRKVSDQIWEVRFLEDSITEEVESENLIPMKALVPSQEVTVMNSGADGGTSNKVTLTAYPDLSKKGLISFYVQFEKIEGIPLAEEKLVQMTEVHLTPSQADAIKRELGGRWSTPSINKSDLDLRNIVVNSRRKAFAASPLATPKRKGKKGGEHVDTEVETETEPSSSTRRKILNTTSEDEALHSKTTRSRRKFKGGKGSLFGGIKFIFTQSRKNSEEVNAPETDTEIDEEESDLNTSLVVGNSPSAERKCTKDLITANGGTILKTFPGIHQKFPKELIVLSDQRCQTMNFLSAIVYNYPRLSFQWVKDSVADKQLLPYTSYALPVGYSEERKMEIEQSEIGVLTKLLKDMNIILTSVDPSFNNDWKLLLSRMGCTCYSRTTGKIDASMLNIHLVIADTKAPETILGDAAKKNIPIVSTKWIIETIINGRKQTFKNFLRGL